MSEPGAMNFQTGAELDEETCAAMASGRADPGIALFIDTLLALRGLDDMFGETAAGALLEREAVAAMSTDALARAFAEIDRTSVSREVSSAHPARAGKTYPELIRLPLRLQAIVRAAEAARGWEYAGPGIRSLQLDLGGVVQTQMMRLSPGARTPVHSHHGREVSLCLIGGFRDARGSYGPGDLSFADPDLVHQPIADDDGVCFVLAVTDAGLKFKGLFGLFQKVFSSRASAAAGPG
jgi:putative transcriptional regulator